MDVLTKKNPYMCEHGLNFFSGVIQLERRVIDTFPIFSQSRFSVIDPNYSRIQNWAI